MRSQNSPSKKRNYFKLTNLIPFLTILTGITAIGFSLLGVIKFTIPEGIIIALLALLAFDALTERLGILGRIEMLIEEIQIGQALRSRDEIPPFTEYSKSASEICIAAVSAIAICPSHTNFFEKKVKEGCNIKIVLLDPNSPHLDTLHEQYGVPSAQDGIKASLKCLEKLVQMKDAIGKFEVRLLEVFLPVSMVAVDVQKESGSVLVEFHSYKKPVDERPHIIITAKENPKWFNSYKEQFDQAWSDGSKWKPQQ
jgi:hypothetical protein